MIKQAEVKKQLKIENEPLLRLMASGIKLTELVMKSAGFEADKTSVHFGQDEKGNIFICEKADGAKIAKNRTFRQAGLQTALLGLADGAPIFSKEDKDTQNKVTKTTKLEEGLQLIFKVADKPVIEEGVKYFQVTFLKARLAEVRSTGEAKPTEDKSVAPATTAAPVAVEAESDDNF